MENIKYRIELSNELFYFTSLDRLLRYFTAKELEYLFKVEKAEGKEISIMVKDQVIGRISIRETFNTIFEDVSRVQGDFFSDINNDKYRRALKEICLEELTRQIYNFKNKIEKSNKNVSAMKFTLKRLEDIRTRIVNGKLIYDDLKVNCDTIFVD